MYKKDGVLAKVQRQCKVYGYYLQQMILEQVDTLIEKLNFNLYYTLYIKMYHRPKYKI